MDWNEVGRRIRTKRKEKKLRQEDLAEMVSLSTSYIGMIERGEKIPSLETFVYLANALDTSTDDLLSGVLDHGYKIRISEYARKFDDCSEKKRRVIYDVVDVMLKGI